MFQRFHRRGPSNPSSPVPEQTSPWETSFGQEQTFATKDAPSRSQSPATSNLPPSLPPIPRVVSGEFTSSYPFDQQNDLDTAIRSDSQSPPTKSPYNGSDQGFIGGVALRKYRQSMQEPSTAPAEPPTAHHSKLPENLLSRSKPPPPPIDTSFASRPPPVPLKQTKPVSNFATPTDLHNATTSARRRPAGTRLVSEPAMPPSSQIASETHKARKGLPFLKNPMSTLLNRRRTGQASSDTAPPPLLSEAYAPIRGTRVHDFSAPRPKRHAPNESQLNDSADRSNQRDALGLPLDSSFGSIGQVSDMTSSYTEASSLGSHRKSAALVKSSSDQLLQDQSWVSEESSTGSLPPVPPKDSPNLRTGTGTRTSKTPSIDTSPAQVRHNPSHTPSSRASRSRNVSLSDASVKEMPAGIPRHMKSTSSRFSFMIGSANQELLLEERHRQKELEKQETTPDAAPRDSRFDDFDEDSFDYDAMMEDDGLEERIPGVNADAEDDGYAYEEEGPYDNESVYGDEMDPDNDQENFAGFVFQRSNPSSSLATPHTAGATITPRDATGDVIGFAMTKDQTPDLSQAPPTTTFYMNENNPQLQPDGIEGLGIQGLSLQGSPEAERSPSIYEQPNERGQTPRLSVDIPQSSGTMNDELYFDDGLMDELKFDAPEGEKFDESLFDINDTDQYGRPIPGAFAQAQALRQSMSQEASKPESNATSRLSGQSQVSQSTTHTSMSVGLQHMTSISEKYVIQGPDPHNHEIAPAMLHSPLTGQDRVIAYQAALAEAAQKAAASGKFRRSSSPCLPREDMSESPPTDAPDALDDYSQADPNVDDYDDEVFAQDMDDYDFDDDAIIAAANAEALANDMDGFYGQEFGFFSAPVHQHGHGHSPAKPASKASAPLNEQNLYEYANGGFFGPSGVGRSTSGRIVSREPNLTPITERSEYSNRNSVMSLGFPPGGINSAGDLRSPGLAQLAMMADDSDMTLSALMRLRSKAFGGSQVSLVSSREGSPKSAAGDREGATSPWNTNGASNGFLGVRDSSHGRMGSQTGFSIRSRDSDAGSGSGSPTLTMNMPVPVSSPSPLPLVPPLHAHRSQSPVVIGSLNGCPPVMEDDEAFDDSEPRSTASAGNNSMSNLGLWMRTSPIDQQQQQQQPYQPVSALSSPVTTTSSTISPVSPQQQQPALAHFPPPTAGVPSRSRPGMGHRHKGSADSISYRKEEEESGETRWVMERRRTGETGEVEILEQEVRI